MSARVLVAGVGELYQGDFDLGRVAAERLASEDLGPEVRIEDVHYGALAFAQMLQDEHPSALLVIGAAARGRSPGTILRKRIHDEPIPEAEAREAIRDAATGHVTVDLAIMVPQALGALPARTLVVEVEPARTIPSTSLSPEARSGLEDALAVVRADLRRLPLLELADRIREALTDQGSDTSPAAATVADLVIELEHLEREGTWGSAFLLRDHLRAHIAAGRTGERVPKLHWALWWALIEEMDRLQTLEATG